MSSSKVSNMNVRTTSMILACFFLAFLPFLSSTIHSGEYAFFRPRDPPVRRPKGSVGWFPKLAPLPTAHGTDDATRLRGGFLRGEREETHTAAEIQSGRGFRGSVEIRTGTREGGVREECERRVDATQLKRSKRAADVCEEPNAGMCTSCRVRRATYGRFDGKEQANDADERGARDMGTSQVWKEAACKRCAEDAGTTGFVLLSRRCVSCPRLAIYGPPPLNQLPQQSSLGLNNNTQGQRQGRGQRAAIRCREHKLAGDVALHGRECAADACHRAPCYGDPASRRPTHCSQHAPPLSVNLVSRSCAAPGCARPPAFAAPDSSPPRLLYCGRHKGASDVNVYARMCRHPEGCVRRASFGPDAGRPLFCRRHSEPTFVNLNVGHSCRDPACAKVPSFGSDSEGVAGACKNHSTFNETSLRTRRCAAPLGCTKRATFGNATARFCASHRPPATHRLFTGSLCIALDGGCGKNAAFGDPDAKRALFCKRHKLPHHINVKRGQCKVAGCGGIARFGARPGALPVALKSARGAEWCYRHRSPGHIDLTNPSCIAHGCSRQAYFANASSLSSAASHCSAHRHPDQVDVRSKRCSTLGCTRQPVFGMLGGSAEVCGQHRNASHIDVKNKRCSAAGCVKRGTFRARFAGPSQGTPAAAAAATANLKNKRGASAASRLRLRTQGANAERSAENDPSRLKGHKDAASERQEANLTTLAALPNGRFCARHRTFCTLAAADAGAPHTTLEENDPS